MLKLYNLGSSSSGNCFVLSFSNKEKTKEHTIMIEAGFPYQEIVKRAVNNGVDMTKVEALIVSHSHADHAKAVLAFHRLGVPVFASKETLEACKIPLRERQICEDWTPKHIAQDITIVPFKTTHDCEGSLGYIINAYGQENTLFVIDSSAVSKDFSKISFQYCIVECNYEDQTLHIVKDQAKKDGDIAMLKNYIRIQQYHCGLSGLIGTKAEPERGLLNHCNLKHCQAIFLTHLSPRTSNAPTMKKKVQSAFPNIKVFICGSHGSYR